MKIKVNDLKLAILFIASLFILGHSFLVLAENTKNPSELFLDSDQDGLSDQEEKTYGTDPKNSDTDGDGYTDGAEVKSGYNPLKPSPGDKLETINSEKIAEITPNLGEKTNLTQQLNQQIYSKINELGDSSDELAIESIRSVIQEVMNENTDTSKYTPLTVSDINIKKQKYSDLSEEERKEKMTKDFTDYSISMFYVLSLNSEKPILSSAAFDKSFSETLEEISIALLNNDISYFDNLEIKTQKTLEEIKEIEIPEEFQDIHVKMINMINYGLSLKKLIIKDNSDPALNLVNFSKINSFFEEFSNFSKEFKLKSNQYELDNDIVKEKLEKMGIDTTTSESKN